MTYIPVAGPWIIVLNGGAYALETVVVNGERAECECPCCCKRTPVTVSIKEEGE
jgi:hypothetical protein